MSIVNGSAARWLLYSLGLRAADTQTTENERTALAKYANGRCSVVEIGVMHGVNTALLRDAMSSEGTVTGIDPHPRGRLGVSFERAIAQREISRCPRGRAVLLRQWSYEAVRDWSAPIDFLFIDGDHTWQGIDRDWKDWSEHVESGGIVALHDSRSIAGRADLDSVRYTEEVILKDERFRPLDEVDTLTVIERL